MSLDNSSLFAGTLRSTLDTPPPLSDGFRRLEALWRETLSAYLAGKFTSEQAAERLSLLKAFDKLDTEWTLGATSKAWYRKLPGSSSWVMSPPPPPSLGDPLPGPWSTLQELTIADFTQLQETEEFSMDPSSNDSAHHTEIPESPTLSSDYSQYFSDEDLLDSPISQETISTELPHVSSDYATFLDDQTQDEEPTHNEDTSITNAELDEAINRFLRGE
jgi:hypothetical protein